MNHFYPEGSVIHTQANKNALSGVSSLKDAIARQTVLEARATLCDREHNLHTDLGVMEGIIPREEGALGVGGAEVRDIALISRVGKPVCFVVTGLVRTPQGRYRAVLSRRKAQEKCRDEYLSALVPGDIIPARVTRTEGFGVFCDVGAGISALLPIDSISVSRIPHPSVRFFAGQDIRAAVRSRTDDGRISLTHKELLGTWEENARLFSVGETVPGIIRSVESYGVFVELTPNLAGLAEYTPDVREGESAAVYIKSILPDRMKIKLVIVDHGEGEKKIPPIRYFTQDGRLTRFRYSPAESPRVVETVFES